jgi:hypothetical protein
MLNLLPSLRLKGRVAGALAALSLVGAGLAPSSVAGQIPQTENFVDVQMVPKVKFDFFKVDVEGQETALNSIAATLQAGDQFKMVPLYNYPSFNLIGNISAGISDDPFSLHGRPPSGLDRFQPDTNFNSSDSYRVTMTYDGAGLMTAAIERTNLPEPAQGIPNFAAGMLPAPPAFTWGNFNLLAMPGEQNPSIPYPINFALRVTPEFNWSQPFAGNFIMISNGSNLTIDGVGIGGILFDNKVFFDLNSPDTLAMDKIVFPDHEYIQPVGMIDGEYQVNFNLHGIERGTDNPIEQKGVVFTEDNVLFSLSPNVLVGGQVRGRIELDPRLTPSGPMEFSLSVAGGPTAVMDWDKYSDAAPVNAPRPVQLAAAMATPQRGQ